MSDLHVKGLIISHREKGGHYDLIIFNLEENP